MSDLRKSLLKGKPPLQVLPTITHSSASTSNRREKCYLPIRWSNYFDSQENVTVVDGTIRVYRRGKEGPVLLFIHGGGFSALSWSVFTKSICNALVCQCVSYDLRGHGDTKLAEEDNLSVEKLTDDLVHLIEALYPNEERPPLVLIGHSLGGAVAVRVTASGRVANIVGLVVIDVVEGSALESLSSMSLVLAGRPKSFKSVDKAIQWSVISSMIRNLESARVSFPGQLVLSQGHLSVIDELDAGRLQPNYFAVHDSNVVSTNAAASSVSNMPTLSEGDEENPTMPPPPPPARPISASSTATSTELIWRIDLNKTSEYWQGWFKGLSNQLLSLSLPKLVVLAGVDRLDKELTVGHMQGKFQLNLLQNCGHIIHEDVPDKLCDVLATFLIRNKLVPDSPSVNKIFPCC